jgi:chromosome segregation ATPase
MLSSLFSNTPLLTQQCYPFRIKLHHHQAHQWRIIQLPKQEKEGLKPCQRKYKKGSKKFLPGCREMLEIKSETSIISLSPISGLDIHYVAIRRALRNVSSRPAVEQKKAKAEQAVKGAQSQTENHKGILANLQAARELKIARKAALEAELKSLSAEIEADDKKIAELPGLIEKTQEEASSALAEVNQYDAELTILSNALKDYHERMEDIH